MVGGGRYGLAAGDMPIVTPSYPAYNSAGNVNPWTLRVMQEELARGSGLAKRAEALARAAAAGTAGTAGAKGAPVRS